MQYILVFIGSGIGGLFRFLIYKLQALTSFSFPLATLFCNFIGSVAIILLFPLIEDVKIKVFLFTGILGGFTTYSMFALELSSTQHSFWYIFCNFVIILFCFFVYKNI